MRDALEKSEILNEKLSVVGKLTRHDIRNKLSTVRMNTFLTRQQLASDHESLKHLNEIESAVNQSQSILEFTRIYEKLGIEGLSYIDVGKTLKDAATLFSDMKGIKITNDCQGLEVLADSLLQQLMYNLIHNSLKHGGKVSQIKVYYKEMEESQLKLVYEDDGVGIPKVEKEKIFEKGYGKGTGYGLYLIKRMCEVYGWTIREDGEEGKGARFAMYIPRAQLQFDHSTRTECVRALGFVNSTGLPNG